MSLGVDEFFRQQVEVIKAKIVAYNTAAANIASGAIQSYEIETGQTRQKVTRANVAELERAIQSLMNQLATLEARLCGAGTTRIVPAF